MSLRLRALIGLISNCVLTIIGLSYIVIGIPEDMPTFIPYILAIGGFIGVIGQSWAIKKS
ncbi:hypothetical protein F9U64_10980 [Gracilibacillus oryzae]|uniref:Uncharacterized protein n=1 Tax=Gracilibacillus oryzae TaxID=1672701 RepID=A0A7C8GU77_9BACI|nr:hypothetical protein [Gracilibacillus oryzae]KAB8135784.1 hypothetical protein F9U64_10980 [Gracilibacillus oryzae]